MNNILDLTEKKSHKILSKINNLTNGEFDSIIIIVYENNERFYLRIDLKNKVKIKNKNIFK